jgi:ParB family chromosome partitioning protein
MQKKMNSLVSIDPSLISTKAFSVRDNDRLQTKIEALKLSIKMHQGNVSPIVVRTSREGGENLYELVYGHRRLQACQDLGLLVLASIRDEITDIDAILVAEHENMHRVDPSALELGRNYRKHLDAKRFPSVRQMADTMGVSHTWANKCLCLADLPHEILDAFPDPHAIQAAMGVKLAHAVEINATLVLERAAEVQQNSDLMDNPSAQRIADFLLGNQNSDKAWLPLSELAPKLGDWRRKGTGPIEIRVNEANSETIASMERLLERCFGFRKDMAPQQVPTAGGN